MSEIVRDGYRRNTFDEWRTRIVGDPRDERADLLVSKLPLNARVLELGCGLGEPKLAPFQVTGVDLVARAPGVIEADFLEVELPVASSTPVCRSTSSITCHASGCPLSACSFSTFSIMSADPVAWQASTNGIRVSERSSSLIPSSFQ